MASDTVERIPVRDIAQPAVGQRHHEGLRSHTLLLDPQRMLGEIFGRDCTESSVADPEDLNLGVLMVALCVHLLQSIQRPLVPAFVDQDSEDVE